MVCSRPFMTAIAHHPPAPSSFLPYWQQAVHGCRHASAATLVTACCAVTGCPGVVTPFHRRCRRLIWLHWCRCRPALCRASTGASTTTPLRHQQMILWWGLVDRCTWSAVNLAYSFVFPGPGVKAGCATPCSYLNYLFTDTAGCTGELFTRNACSLSFVLCTCALQFWLHPRHSRNLQRNTRQHRGGCVPVRRAAVLQHAHGEASMHQFRC